MLHDFSNIKMKACENWFQIFFDFQLLKLGFVVYSVAMLLKIAGSMH